MNQIMCVYDLKPGDRFYKMGFGRVIRDQQVFTLLHFNALGDRDQACYTDSFGKLYYCDVSDEIVRYEAV